MATRIRGRWRAAEPVPGSIALNTGEIAVTTSVSCARATCVAGGYYNTKSDQGLMLGYLAAEHGGTWSRAAQVPGLAALSNNESSQVIGVSCAPDGYCAAMGEYSGDPASEERMFETTRSGGPRRAG